MTSEPRVESASGSGRATSAYIVGLWAALGLLTAFGAARHGGPGDWGGIAVLTLCATAAWRFPGAVDSHLTISASSIVVFAGVALLTPVEVALVAGTSTLLEARRFRVRTRVFNTAMSAVMALVAGEVYLAVGGVRGGAAELADFSGPAPILREVAIPLAVAGTVHVLVNCVLLSGVIRVASLTPFQVSFMRMLRGNLGAMPGNWLVALLLVILWAPAGLGPFSVVLLVVPMVGAGWSYHLQRAERTAHERTLEVLVAAIETKAPHLVGHSWRVAQLATATAETLGLPPQEITTIRYAGMLHDLGLVALGTPAVAAAAGGDYAEEHAAAPRLGAGILAGLTFLTEARRVIEALPGRADEPLTDRSVAASIVHLTDSYDLLAHGVGSGGLPLASATAIELLRARHPESPAITDALERTLVRVASEPVSP